MAKKTKSTFSHNIALIWIGILIPITVALIPYAARYISPDIDLHYQLHGPVVVDDEYAFSVDIRNDGNKPLKNIKVWIPYDHSDTGIPELNKSRHIKYETSSSISVESSKDKKFKIFSIDTLRPTEKANISIMMGGHGIYLIDFRYTNIKVVSDEAVGILDEQDEFLLAMYQFGSLMFLVLMLLTGIYGAYYTYFMDPKKKEEMILKEIDKLK